jgi:hypothetical protein
MFASAVAKVALDLVHDTLTKSQAQHRKNMAWFHRRRLVRPSYVSRHWGRAAVNVLISRTGCVLPTFLMHYSLISMFNNGVLLAVYP